MSASHTAFEAMKATPPIVAGSAWLMGYTINEWAAAAAFVYTLLLIGQTLFRWGQAWRARRKKS
jgi:hypothetical protein